MPLFHYPNSIDDRLDLANPAELPWMRSGVKVGLGFFETLRARNDNIEAMERHFERLKNSCETFSLPSPSYHVFKRALREALQNAAIETPWARLRYSVTSTSAHPSGLLCIAEAEAFTPYTDQASLLLLPWACASLTPMVGHKSLSYANHLWGFNHAKSLGFDEGLWLNEQGHIAEACTSNVFWLKDGTLYTPALKTGCLPGIARQVVIEVAERLKWPVQEGYFKLTHLFEADEAFLTSSLRGVQAIKSLKTHDLEVKWGISNATAAIKSDFVQFFESQSVLETKNK